MNSPADTIMVGHGKATTDSERRKFKLDEMEDLANDVLDARPSRPHLANQS